MWILVVGASGYIGGRLVPLLAAQGHDLVLMSRDARPIAARFPQATVVVADLLHPSTLPLAAERAAGRATEPDVPASTTRHLPQPLAATGGSIPYLSET